MFLLAALLAISPVEASVTREAERFMAEYGDDLRRGDREAIAARYHSGGTIFLGNGNKQTLTKAQVAAGYLEKWSPPAAFAWRDLDYEPIGPDAVVVTGRFDWTRTVGTPPETQSYMGLLRREGALLKIRIEDESRPLPKAARASASAKP
jgi:hypothetical protein